MSLITERQYIIILSPDIIANEKQHLLIIIILIRVCDSNIIIINVVPTMFTCLACLLPSSVRPYVVVPMSGFVTDSRMGTLLSDYKDTKYK